MSLLFRPIRILILCGSAFVAGVFYERSNQQGQCDAVGGAWSRDGICIPEVSSGG